MTRTPYQYLEVAAFLLFIGLGFWIGSSFGSDPVVVRADLDQPAPALAALPALPDGERIILIAGTDQLDTLHPRLESLWLLTYYLDNQPIQLLPIYPSGNRVSSEAETELLENFSLVQAKGRTSLNPAFLQILTNENYWISGYLVLDSYASAQIINLLGGLATDRGVYSGEQIIANMPNSSQQPLEAHYQQAVLYGQACLTLSRLSSPPDWETILQLLQGHLITDVQPLQLINEIEYLTQDLAHLQCQFPSLSETSIPE